MDLLQRFKDNVNSAKLFNEKDKLLLAVSGGVDSVVLCELCKQAGFDFIIAHCNFKLRGEESDRDEQFVKKLAAKYGVPFYVKGFDTTSISTEQKKSIEETARDLRYKWFYELLDSKTSPIPADELPTCILTAHHADDNIETVAMNFFRGTGIKGMRGILPVNGKIVRPLLFLRRNEIEDFAWKLELKYVQDSTNQENAFTRNFFRNRILLEVNKFYPETSKNILHNIERFAEAEELYNQAITLHKKKLLEKKGNEIHIPVLKLKKAAPLHTIVYEIIKDFGFTAHQTAEAVALLDSDTGKYISSSTHRIIKNRNWLIIAPQSNAEAQNILIETSLEEVSFSLGKLSIKTTPTIHQQPSTNNHVAELDAAGITFPLILRKWKAGDYFYPLGMKKKKKLNRFFIDQKLSKTEKENAWVIESDRRILWVVGYRIDDRFKLTNAAKETLRLELRPSQ